MTVPLNLNELRQNTAFMEDLHNTIFIYRLSLRAYRMAREEIVKLIDALEQELEIE
jgi:hypothetical protein